MINTFPKKRYHILILLIFSLLILTGVGYESIMKIKVKAESAKVRFEASMNSGVVANVGKGEIFTIDIKEGEWYKISFLDKKTGFNLTGFIHQNEVELLEKKSVTSKATEDSLSSVPKEIVTGKRAPDNLRFSISKKITYTTTDFKYEYEIIGICTHYQEFASLSLRDPLVGALKKGMKEFEKKVIKMRGDAVVGLRYNFANRTQKDEGRLLIYGTVVKFK